MFAEDLSVFLNPAEFGTAATGLDAHGVLVEFTVLFDAATEPQFGGMVADSAPQALCQTADVEHVAWDSGLTVGTTAYSVANIAHDGTGMTTLTLREA